MAITAEERAHRKAVATTRPCDRCGTPRKVRDGRAGTGLCRDCHYVEPHWPYEAANTPDGSGDTRCAAPRATLPAPTRRGPA